MARKWYVVIVGKDIGVFPNWVEAGPLVKGVPDAVHQSFRSEEEAKRVFALAFFKGDTRIVDVRRNDNQHTSTGAPKFSSGSTNSNSKSIATISSVPPTNTLSACLSPPQHRSQAIDAHDSFNGSSNLYPGSHILSKPAHNSSHYNDTDKDTQVSTPQSDPTGLSPTSKWPSRRPRVIVKTPSWLASYPKSPQLLSPLHSEYLSLNNFRTSPALNGNGQGIKFKPSPLSSSIYLTRTPRMPATSPQSNESVSDSSILFSPPVRRVHVVHEQDKDPRSPMLNHVKVPILGLNHISFARPSPSLRRDQFPTGLQFEAPSSSLLFHSNRSAVQKEDHF